MTFEACYFDFDSTMVWEEQVIIFPRIGKNHKLYQECICLVEPFRIGDNSPLSFEVQINKNKS
jgi:hypothetical protein